MDQAEAGLVSRPHCQAVPPGGGSYSCLLTCCRNDADALLFTYGKANDGYSKSLAMQYHFFGTQIPNMMLAVVPGAIHIVASPDVCEQIKSVVRDDAEVRPT